MGPQGQPNHPRVKEVEAEVAGRVHAAGRKMTSGVIVAAGAPRLFLGGAREFLRAERVAKALSSGVWNLEEDSEWESPICTHHCTNIGMSDFRDVGREHQRLSPRSIFLVRLYSGMPLILPAYGDSPN